MKKKSILIIILVLIIISLSSLTRTKTLTSKIVNYNGNNLRVSIDDNEEKKLPTTGNYYLTSYKCNNPKTKITWDRKNYKLDINNQNSNSGISCNLTFKSTPLLSEMSVGSYVDYTATGGNIGSKKVTCSSGDISCTGIIANSSNDGTYGYCKDEKYKYTTKGYRIAYTKQNDSSEKQAFLVSASSLECINNIENADTKAIKYCNLNYVDGDCSCQDNDNNGVCDSASSDVWSINDNDFYAITKEISGVGRKLTNFSSKLDAVNCDNTFSSKECGYNNDILDNGGYYYFNAKSNNNSIYWDPAVRSINTKESGSLGLRPVIKMSSNVVVTGGDGTINSPYTISNNDIIINDDNNNYVNSNDITINLLGTSISTFCVSNTKECKNYEPFASKKIWKLKEGVGEKDIYVYYKDKNDKIISKIHKKIVVDTTAPSNNNIKIVKTVKNMISLDISSAGADYMCFTEENNSSNCEWLNYNKNYTYTLGNTKNGSKVIYGFFKDKAGNISSKSLTYKCKTCSSTFTANYTFASPATIDSINQENLIKIEGNWQFDEQNKYLKSSNYNQNETTSTAIITFTPTSLSNLSFDYGVSSESNYDKLTIELESDGRRKTLVNAISGIKEGTIDEEQLLANKTYKLILSYKKDSIGNRNSDIGYIKRLTIE